MFSRAKLAMLNVFLFQVGFLECRTPRYRVKVLLVVSTLSLFGMYDTTVMEQISAPINATHFFLIDVGLSRVRSILHLQQACLQLHTSVRPAYCPSVNNDQAAAKFLFTWCVYNWGELNCNERHRRRRSSVIDRPFR